VNCLEVFVKDVIAKEVVTANYENCIKKASKVTAEKRREYAVLLTERRPVGIVTERDFV